MNTQEALNKMWDWFVVQKKPRSTHSEERDCAYRSKNGSACAVGCLIPDNLYSPRIEGYNIRAVLAESNEFSIFFSDVDKYFLYQAQLLHDSGDARYMKANIVTELSQEEFTQLMKMGLIDLAKKFGLKVPE